ncbi:unnamed protein product [Amoebophrya sp. A120]|nr:unnamed protein product [Amoebophrya sp. A120]|eukprot:GSA120T00024288001.1
MRENVKNMWESRIISYDKREDLFVDMRDNLNLYSHV